MMAPLSSPPRNRREDHCSAIWLPATLLAGLLLSSLPLAGCGWARQQLHLSSAEPETPPAISATEAEIAAVRSDSSASASSDEIPPATQATVEEPAGDKLAESVTSALHSESIASSAPPAPASSVTRIPPKEAALRWGNQLSSGHWQPRIPGEEASTWQQPSPWLWKHEGLQLLAQEPDAMELLTELTRSDDARLALLAGIALARASDPHSATLLTATVESQEYDLRHRAAAAESLGPLKDDVSTEELLRLLATADKNDPTMVQLHAALLAAIAWREDWEDRDAVILEALYSKQSALQQAALVRWRVDSATPLPQRVLDMRIVADPLVRGSVVELIALRKPPAALDYLSIAASDTDPRVRRAALLGLGRLGTDEARGVVLRSLKGLGETDRSAAVTALALAGDLSTVLTAAEDESWRVRQAVCQQLSALPDREEASRYVRQFMRDSSGEVRREAIATMRNWPLPVSGPLLLESLSQRELDTRQAAAELFARRWPPAAEFIANAPADSRAAALARLQQQWEATPDMAAQSLRDVAQKAAERVQDELDPRTVEHIAILVDIAQNTADPVRQQAARDELQGMEGDLELALEQLLHTGRIRLEETFWEEVLAQRNALQRTVYRLSAADLVVRRQAAAELGRYRADLAAESLAVRRILELVRRETDPQVWRNVLSAIEQTSAAHAKAIAYAAASHPEAEVRRRACEYLANHPAAEHAPILAEALTDRNAQVVATAVQAIGAARQWTDPSSLEALLVHADPQVRIQAATTLALLGEPSGRDALMRLAADHDANVRRQVAETIGRLQDPTLAGTLVDLLDDNGSIRRAAQDSLQRLATPAGAAGPLPTDQSGWRAWYDQQKAATLGRIPPPR